MNKKILAITFAAMAMFGLSSCEDYFDDVPDNATSLEDVFTNRGQSLSWLTMSTIISRTGATVTQALEEAMCLSI